MPREAYLAAAGRIRGGLLDIDAVVARVAHVASRLPLASRSDAPVARIRHKQALAAGRLVQCMVSRYERRWFDPCRSELIR